ncbi:hypothetical protein [Paraherbaspirillum soli]|uniref:DUF4148 domain-containing protein n=1 Tax=Paraherbaspirillum soli TaxID=631222 RepID=A0ABW0M8B6_9BURK
MKTLARITLSLAAVATIGGMLTSNAFAADSQWQKNHPRREQVNNRLKNQNKRITNEVKEGEISKAQAKQLRSNDKGIRTEERAMAAQNGGHITKQEQKTLNQQLNQNSAAIGK